MRVGKPFQKNLGNETVSNAILHLDQTNPIYRSLFLTLHVVCLTHSQMAEKREREDDDDVGVIEPPQKRARVEPIEEESAILTHMYILVNEDRDETSYVKITGKKAGVEELGDLMRESFSQELQMREKIAYTALMIAEVHIENDDYWFLSDEDKEGLFAAIASKSKSIYKKHGLIIEIFTPNSVYRWNDVSTSPVDAIFMIPDTY
jgi:hypothetical protein